MTTESEKSINSLRKIMEEGDELRKFIRPKEAIRIYSLSRAFIEEIARESGAMYKIGKVVLINVKTFEDYLEQHKLMKNPECQKGNINCINGI